VRAAAITRGRHEGGDSKLDYARVTGNRSVCTWVFMGRGARVGIGKIKLLGPAMEGVGDSAQVSLSWGFVIVCGQ
jgi:hypothetical protein